MIVFGRFLTLKETDWTTCLGHMEKRGTRKGQNFDLEPQKVKNKVTMGKTNVLQTKSKKFLGPTKHLIRT